MKHITLLSTLALTLTITLTLTGCDTESEYEPYSGITADTAIETEYPLYSNIISDTKVEAETEEEINSESDSYIGNTYYVTPYGKKYHKETCRYIREAKNGYREITETQAKKGYTACKICKP